MEVICQLLKEWYQLITRLAGHLEGGEDVPEEFGKVGSWGDALPTKLINMRHLETLPLSGG